MMLLQFFIIGVFATTFCSANVKNYEGHNVYRVTPKIKEHVEKLISLETSGISFWEGPSDVGHPSDIMLSPHEQNLGIISELTELGIGVELFIDNVNKLIQEHNVLKEKGITRELSWDQYYSLSNIHSFVDEVAAANPNVATVFSIGNSTEGRDLKVIKISRAQPGERKPVIFIDANIHAREWITSAVATYLINELVNGNNSNVTSWTEDFEWYVLPVVNPDGLAFTQTADRMWRKSRSNTSSPLGCKGADLNRNFDYHWLGGGSSTNPCSETFAGGRVFSEPETVALAAFVDTIPDLALYISLHSYSQFIMFPYGDTADIPQYDSYMAICRRAADAISARYNTQFLPGNWLDILYLSTGTSMDWVQNRHNSSISLTYELRDQGSYGFLLPPNQIEPSALEFIDSLYPTIDEIRRLRK